MKLTPVQKRIVEALKEHGTLTSTKLKEAAETSHASISVFIKVFNAQELLNIENDKLDYRTRYISLVPGAYERIMG